LNQKELRVIKKFVYKSNNVIAYNDFGLENGFPVLVHHGSIASINDTGLLENLSRYARVICVARPGYGESSPYVLENILEYGKIVSGLVEELKINQFDVLSSSAGAPYGYALAKVCSAKTRNIYVYSGTPALYDAEVQKNWPYPVSKDLTLEDAQKIAYEVFFSNFSEQEKEDINIKDSMANNCFGEAQNLRLRFKDWGFTLAEISAKVFMRHSKKDEVLPYIMAERSAQLLKNCELELLEEGGHFSAEAYGAFVRETVLKNLHK
jgi:pimeloyl-ACP methyl ester carboxylesterase